MTARTGSRRTEKPRRKRRDRPDRAKGEDHPRRPASAPDAEWRPLALVLAAALAVKLAVLVELGDHPLLGPQGDLDTAAYIHLARRVAAGGPLALNGPFFVSPLYVYFLAVIFRLFDSLAAVKLVQILLGAAAAGFVYLTAREWFGPRAAAIAAALFILTGVFTFYEVLVLQAALDPFLAASTLYFISRGQRDGRRGVLLAAGIAAGLFALNRPNALAYAAAAAILIAFTSRRRNRETAGAHVAEARAWLTRPAVFVAGALLVLGPNAIRNYAASGDLVLVSSHGGLNFYIGNNPEADGTYTRVPGIRPSIAGQAEDATRVAEEEARRRLSPSEVSEHFYRRAGEWMASNPGDAARLFVRKLALVLNGAEAPLNYSFAFYRDESAVLRALAAGAWILVPLGLVGLFLPSARVRRSGFWVWGSFVPIYGLSVAAFFVSSRYRLPLLVPLAASAGAAVLWMSERLREGNRRALAAGAAAVVLAAALAHWNLGVDDGRGGEQTRRAVWLVEQGRYDEARAYVERIADAHSHPGVLRFQVGKALATAGRFDAAIQLLREALSIDRGQAAIHLELGQTLLVAGRSEEAVPHLEAAREAGFRPEVSGPWLVRALAAAGRAERAAALLAELPDAVAAPGTETAIELGTLALAVASPDQAERWLKRAVAEAPGRANAHESLGVSLILLGRPADAVPPLETACRLDPQSASAHLNLAVAYAELGRLEEAGAAAEKAVRLDPSEPRAAALLKQLKRGQILQ